MARYIKPLALYTISGTLHQALYTISGTLHQALYTISGTLHQALYTISGTLHQVSHDTGCGILALVHNINIITKLGTSYAY